MQRIQNNCFFFASSTNWLLADNCFFLSFLLHMLYSTPIRCTKTKQIHEKAEQVFNSVCSNRNGYICENFQRASFTTENKQNCRGNTFHFASHKSNCLTIVLMILYCKDSRCPRIYQFKNQFSVIFSDYSTWMVVCLLLLKVSLLIQIVQIIYFD